MRPLTVALRRRELRRRRGRHGDGRACASAVRWATTIPEQVSVDYTVVPGTATPESRLRRLAGGTLIFTRGGATEQTFTVATLQDLKHEGGETVILRLTGATGVELGFVTQAVLNIDDDDPFDPNLLDDFETDAGPVRGGGRPRRWRRSRSSRAIPLALPGQGRARACSTWRRRSWWTSTWTSRAAARAACHGIVTRGHPHAPRLRRRRPWTTTTVRFGLAREIHRDRHGRLRRHVEDFDRDGDLDLVFHFDLTPGFDCDDDRAPLTGRTFAGKRIVHNGYARFGRDFAGSQDWTLAEGLSFWFYGTGSGDASRSQVKDNRAPDPGPARLAAPLERRVPRPAPAAARPARVEPRDRRRHGQQHPRLGQQRAAVLHRRSRPTPPPTARATS